MAGGYYLVRDGYFPSGQPHWLVARWLPSEEVWHFHYAGAEKGMKVPFGYFREIGARVA
jgi:hypothetical protein